jgi:hypothetical protein
MKADQIHIHLSQNKDRATAVRVSWPRMEAERLFIGQSARRRGHDALAVHPVCQAQSLAARLVLQQAAGQHATAVMNSVPR